jgi:lipid-A-disaccharide synthase
MTCFLVAGERSGDRHGASLVSELRSLVPNVAIHGLGGPEMHALSPTITDWIEEAGVVGLVEVLRKYPWFRRRFSETLQSINSLKPDAVILIDYPGFNLRLAAALRKSGFSGRIIYYISPQVWAWHRSRIPKMARLLDLMLCIFPFEKALYEGCGLPTVFTGHPLVAWHRARRLPEGRDPLLVGLFPGSRRREITKHFPPLLEAASILARDNPSLRFAASAASPALAALMQEFAARHPVPNLTIETGTVHTLMQRSVCGAVASGTATLEAAIHGLPHTLIYKVSPATYAAGKLLIRVPFLGIVNILANRELVRELIQHHCSGPQIAAELSRLLLNPDARTSLVSSLTSIVNQLDGQNAYLNAATAIIHSIQSPPPRTTIQIAPRKGASL